MTEKALAFFTVFFFALGGCIGSFLNVVIWRLPHRGELVTFGGKTARLTLSWPPSHCPHCDTAIPWFENIPILAWIFLRGRCARCRAPIAIRYPLVELATALLFSGLFLAYFVAGFPDPQRPVFVNIRTDWPPFLLHLTLVAALLAASAIDADWFIIPLSIPAFLTIVALVTAPFANYPVLPQLELDPARVFSVAKLGLPILAACFGLLLANILLHLHLLPLSFPPPPEEATGGRKTNKTAQAGAPGAAPCPTDAPIAPPPNFTRSVPLIVGATMILALLGTAWLITPPPHKLAALASVIAAILIFLLGILPRDPAPPGSISVAQEVLDEISVPNARREILKEILFIAFPLLFGLVALAFPIELPAAPWLARLLGACSASSSAADSCGSSASPARSAWAARRWA